MLHSVANPSEGQKQVPFSLVCIAKGHRYLGTFRYYLGLGRVLGKRAFHSLLFLFTLDLLSHLLLFFFTSHLRSILSYHITHHALLHRAPLDPRSLGCGSELDLLHVPSGIQPWPGEA
jgi:hypothetical protein